MSLFPRRIGLPGSSLREVAPSLFVGGLRDVCDPHAPRWAAALLLDPSLVEQAQMHGSPVRTRLAGVQVAAHAFNDGDAVPSEAIRAAVAGRQATRGKPMIIACFAGRSRSVSVAYATLRICEGLDHAEALRRVAHPEQNPMNATLASAREFVRRHRAQTTQPGR